MLRGILEGNMQSEDLNTTQESLEEIDHMDSYVDSEKVRDQKMIEEEERFASQQREHDLLIAQMVEEIRGMEMELREIEYIAKMDEEQEAKGDDQFKQNMQQVGGLYYKLGVSCFGMIMNIFLVYLVLTVVGVMLAEPEFIGDPAKQGLQEEDPLEGEEIIEVEDLLDQTNITDPLNQTNLTDSFLEYENTTIENDDEISLNLDEERLLVSLDNKPKSLLRLQREITTSFNNFNNRLLQTVLIILPDSLKTKKLKKMTPKTKIPKWFRNSGQNEKQDKKNRKKSTRSRSKLQMKSEKKKKAWLKKKALNKNKTIIRRR